MGALEVAPSVRPIRNGVTDYSSNNPTTGQPAPTPANPVAGRANNQGFEGLSISPDGKTLFVGLQSAARQDINLASAAATRDHTRIFTYDISSPDNIRLSGEYVVRLPKFVQGSATLVAAQSELLALSSTQLLMLPRDSNGNAVGTQTSLLRQVEIIDLEGATNILGTSFEAQVAPGGVLNPAIVPAAKRLLLDINDRSQLNRFGLTNGLQAGFENLSEKWEGMALLPALDAERPDDYFLFIANDNDFATTDGFHAGAAYNDGKNLDTMFLAYRVTISAVPEPGSALLMLPGRGWWQRGSGASGGLRSERPSASALSRRSLGAAARRHQATTRSGWPPAGSTRPTTAAALKPWLRKTASTASTVSGLQATSRPPLVCGSVSRAWSSAAKGAGRLTSCP